ncbi:MAG TPA: diguanylate cyclase [Gemmatimonadales bacterium]|nr:diguanylate cyclase [Gemmatimonadales bacterium]
MTDTEAATVPRSTRVLLLGDATARPEGLERALARGGFRVYESDDPRADPATDAAPEVILVTALAADAALADTLEAAAYAFGPAMPRVVALADPDREGPYRALSYGADDALAAPIHLPELCARLLIRRRAPSSEARTASVSSLNASFDLAYDVYGSLRAEEVLHQLCRRVARALDLARCSFVLTPPDAGHGRVAADFERPGTTDLTLDLSRYPEIAEARRTGEPVVIGDAQSDPLFHEARRKWAAQHPGIELRSVVALPVVVESEVAGVFLLRPRERVRLTPAQVAFADSLARAAARVLATGSAHGHGAVMDPLTGCGTVVQLEERVRAEFERARRYSLGFSLVLLDIDGLSRFNELLGDDGGDRLLAEMAGVLRATVRVPDLVCRYGGDEFAILLPETGSEGARASIGRLRSRLGVHEFTGLGTADRPEVTAGVVSFPHPAAERTDDLLALAEAALLRAKGQTSGRIGVAEYVAG